MNAIFINFSPILWGPVKWWKRPGSKIKYRKPPSIGLVLVLWCLKLKKGESVARYRE